MPRPSALIESKFDVLMCSTANIKSAAGQAQRMTDIKRMRRRGWQRMTKSGKQWEKRERGQRKWGERETC